MFSDQMPKCETPDDCRFVCLGGTTTLIGWQQTYDRQGNPVGGHDPNKTTNHYKCTICGSKWSETKSH